MRVLVTGASGFVGAAVVQSAVRAGHQVVALVRPTARLDTSNSSGPEASGSIWNDPHVEVLRGDLRERGPWTAGLTGIDAVAHLAAAGSGDLGTQFQGTVLATEHLLGALDLAALRRFVHVSSFSVYDFDAIAAGATLDERSPIEDDLEQRDAYTTTKLVQEQLVRDTLAATPTRTATELVVIRPGAVFGPGKDWDFGLAMRLGSRRGLLFAPRSSMRLTYVDNCADAIVAALEAPLAAGATFNIVDDDAITYRDYLQACRTAGAATPSAIAVPWTAVVGFGRLVAFIDRIAFDGRAKLPEFAASTRQAARWKPLRYSTAEARRLLAWTPKVSFAEGVRRTVAPTGSGAP